MHISKRLATTLALAGLLGWTVATLDARTKKGDQLYNQGSIAEEQKDYEKALLLYEQALTTDPSDALYQMGMRRVRFQAGQAHVDKGEAVRNQGNLEEALTEFQKAVAIDPSSPIAIQEVQRTLEMIELDKKRTTPASPEERGMTPAERARRDTDARLATVMSIPVLKPLPATPIFFKANNMTPRVVLETVCKNAGINVVFDTDQNVQSALRTPPMSVEFSNATIEEALHYVAIQAKLFWKPITANAIFVTADTQAKRQEVEETVTRVFYILNARDQNDLNEYRQTVTQMTGATRVAISNAQSAVVVRGTADQVALAELLIRDLDRPRPEVVVDLILMEANRGRSRQLASTLVSGSGNGISIPIGYSPRDAITQSGSTTDGTASAAARLNTIGRTSTADFQLTLPGALLEAFMKDSGARILQSPQVRAVDGMKASLKIGDRVPYSSGGFQPTFGQVGGTGLNSLYNSFQFLDVGVNVDILPKVHGTDEVTLHIELDVSNVKERIDIAGISQPVVGRRLIVHDIRLREGEVNLLGGLVQEQETKSVSGVPGLASIPILKRLFTSENIDRTNSELMVAIIPHIVRTPDLDDLNYKGIATGPGANQQQVRLTYASPRGPETQAEPGTAAPAGAAPQVTPPATEPIKPAPATPSSPPAAGRIVFGPPTAEAQPGGTVDLSIQVENVTDLFSAPLRIKFDPNVLRLDEAARGNFLSGDGQEVIFTTNIANNTGDVTINLRRRTGTAGVSGSGTLATLSFQVIGKGVTAVTAPQLAFQDSRAQTILSASPQVIVTIK